MDLFVTYDDDDDDNDDDDDDYGRGVAFELVASIIITLITIVIIARHLWEIIAIVDVC